MQDTVLFKRDILLMKWYQSKDSFMHLVKVMQMLLKLDISCEDQKTLYLRIQNIYIKVRTRDNKSHVI